MLGTAPSVDAIIQDDTQTQTGPQHIRITNHGKMNTWVAFALDSLEKNEDRPVVLHTLPTAPQAPTDAQTPGPQRPAGSLSNSTTTIPRLISVVEIIKREYIKTLELKHSPRLSGLHQYNEIGSLEDLGLAVTPRADESSRAEELAAALSGKKHVQQKQTPYMRVTLSVNELGEEYKKQATYQPPTMRKLSKSAKVRAKKRERNAKKAEGALEEKDGGDGDGDGDGDGEGDAMNST